MSCKGLKLVQKRRSKPPERASSRKRKIQETIGIEETKHNILASNKAQSLYLRVRIVVMVLCS
jgi:hypothetical protein